MVEYNHSLLTPTNYMLRTENHPDYQLSEWERFAAIDFNDFLYRVVKFEIEDSSSNERLYHQFLNNHYLWSLCCADERCSMARDIEMDRVRLRQCMVSAMEVIRSADIVFVKDWVQDLRVQHFVNELFFVDNNVDDQEKKFVAVKKKSYSVGKMGTNYMFDPDNEPLLDLLNKYDVQLFQWIQDLVFNRTHVVWETSRHNKNNRNELVYDLGAHHILTHSENVTVLYDLPGE